MKHNPKFTCTIWRVSLILIILHALPLKGQQIGSAPVITLTSPSVIALNPTPKTGCDSFSRKFL